jgi:ABC-type ATPase with predicted acetyltransferase domain
MTGWTIVVNARIRRPAPRRAAARKLAEMFGLAAGAWEALYEDFQLTIEPGQIVAVIGPSGCGKSVLLRQVLARIPAATVLETQDLSRSDTPAIGMVEVKQMAGWLEVLSRCGLAEAAVLVTPARCLSAGQLYRLALARLLWRARRRGRPTLIVADEFAANLDDDTAAALAGQIRKWVRREGLGLVVATSRPDALLLKNLQPDQVVVKPLGRPGWIVRPNFSTRQIGKVSACRWPITAGSIHDYHALADFHYLTGPPAAHKRVYVIRRPRCRHRRAWSSAAAPDVAAVLVISPPLIGVRGRDVATAGRYGNAADAGALTSPPHRRGITPQDESRSGKKNPRGNAAGFPSSRVRGEVLARLNEEVECISRVIVHPTYRSCGLAVRLVRHALRTSPAAVVEALAVMGRVHPFFELAGMMSWYVGGAGTYVYYDHVDAARSARGRRTSRPRPVVRAASSRPRHRKPLPNRACAVKSSGGFFHDQNPNAA